MALHRCEVCGNDYDKTFQVTMAGATHTFDSFECAIQALAPKCKSCSVSIVGHGVESGNHIYCCASCAHRQGVQAVKDRA